MAMMTLATDMDMGIMCALTKPSGFGSAHSQKQISSPQFLQRVTLYDTHELSYKLSFRHFKYARKPTRRMRWFYRFPGIVFIISGVISGFVGNYTFLLIGMFLLSFGKISEISDGG
jgi:hypothetical protein